MPQVYRFFLLYLRDFYAGCQLTDCALYCVVIQRFVFIEFSV